MTRRFFFSVKNKTFTALKPTEKQKIKHNKNTAFKCNV